MVTPGTLWSNKEHMGKKRGMGAMEGHREVSKRAKWDQSRPSCAHGGPKKNYRGPQGLTWVFCNCNHVALCQDFY